MTRREKGDYPLGVNRRATK